MLCVRTHNHCRRDLSNITLFGTDALFSCGVIELCNSFLGRGVVLCHTYGAHP